MLFDLAEPMRPVGFSGDSRTEGRLLGRPCRDFNVMSSLKAVHHELQVLRLGSRPVTLEGQRVVICLEGAVREGQADIAPMDLVELDGPLVVEGWGSLYGGSFHS